MYTYLFLLKSSTIQWSICILDANTDSLDDSTFRVGEDDTNFHCFDIIVISLVRNSSNKQLSSFEVDGRICLEGVVSISMHSLDLLQFIKCLLLQTHIWNIHNKSHSCDMVWLASKSVEAFNKGEDLLKLTQ